MVDEAYRIYFIDNSINRIVGWKYNIYAITLSIIAAICINITVNNIIIKYSLSIGIAKVIEGVVLIIFSCIIFNFIYKHALKKAGYLMQSFLADFSGINKYRKQQLKNYLDIRLNKDNRKEVLDKLYLLIDEEIDRQKNPTLINWAIVAAIIGPVWLNFVESIFQKYIYTISDAFKIFILIIIIILILIYIFSVFTERFKEFVNVRYIRLKKLRNLINEIEFEWLNEKRFDT